MRNDDPVAQLMIAKDMSRFAIWAMYGPEGANAKLAHRRLSVLKLVGRIGSVASIGPRSYNA